MAHFGIPSCPVNRLSSPQAAIQSPYIHRANGLLQIAVSTLLRTDSIGNREFLPAEHCRYGTRDLASTGILQRPHKVLCTHYIGTRGKQSLDQCRIKSMSGPHNGLQLRRGDNQHRYPLARLRVLLHSSQCRTSRTNPGCGARWEHSPFFIPAIDRSSRIALHAIFATARVSPVLNQCPL